MALQVVNISNSEVNFLDETKDPLKQAELLKAENDMLRKQLEQTNNDLVGFMDFYFSNTPGV